MRAVVYDLSVAKHLLARGFGRWFPSLYHGPLSCLSMRDWPEPELPGPLWLRLRVTLTGICGSDMGAILHKASPSLSPYSSFPCVLGHEVVGTVEEVGSGVQGLARGDRVTIDPFLSCSIREIEPECPSCARGNLSTCERAGGGGRFGPAKLIGYSRDLPGSWSERLLCHARQVFKVPDGVPDKLAVLIEPLSIGVRAVLRRPPAPQAHVLVIGGGMIGFSVVAALRLLDIPCRVTHVVWSEYQREVSRTLGADETLLGRGDMLPILADRCGAKLHKPILGRAVISGGFEIVYDCVGSRESLDDALRLTGPGGTLLLIGAAGVLPKLDWSFIWSKDLTVLGLLGHGVEELPGRPHTFEVTRSLLVNPRVAVEKLVTHTFPLSRYPEAITANLARNRYRSVKVLLDPCARSTN